MEKQNKFKGGLYKAVKEENAFNEKQERLKKKYQINKKDVVVVEKNNMVKFFVRILVGTLRFTATAALLILATIGLLTLAYPQIRAEFVQVITEIMKQLQTMV